MGISLCGDEMARSRTLVLEWGIRPGTVLCAVVAAALWLSPLSAGIALADEAAQAGPGATGTEVAQYYSIEVPARRDMVERGKTVLERWRPDYIPLGIRAGSFIIRPGLDVQENYTDNVFSTKSSEKSDFITRFMPRVSAASTWSNHAVSAFASANIGRHKEYSFEDYEDYTLGATGRLDILRSTKVSGRVETQKRHESRDSPDDPGALRPQEYDVHIARVDGSHRINRVSFSLGLGVEQYDYDGAPTRDRSDYTTSLRVGYELVQNYEAFVRLTYNIRDYDRGMDGAGLDHDSDGYEAVAGVRIDFGGITFGDFFLGYRRQDYQSPVFNDSSGPMIGADITWNVTPLTTFIGTITREIRESTLGDGMGNFASGSFYTTFAINAQHELLRNLILEGDLSYSNDDFKGINRSDDIFFAGLGARYFMTRNFYIRGGYEHRMRDSNLSGVGFTENVVFVRLQAQY